MIANLMTTLLLALSVATGNVSSNVYKGGNAFNHEIEHHEKKPQIKKQVETATGTYNLVNSYETAGTEGGNVLEYKNRKYYIDNQQTFNSTIANIYSTGYSTSHTTGTSYTAGTIFCLYKITPYITSTNTELTLNWQFYFTNTNGISESYRVLNKCYRTYNNYDQYQDLTIYSTEESNNGINQTELSKLVKRINSSSEQGVTLLDSVMNDYNVPPSTNRAINYEYNIGTIQDEVTIIIESIIERLNSTPNYPSLNIDLNTFTIEGNVIPINYEVIDIPNLMFTILTMPFTFYSTAFNLTIFPGTPYALNFGNLILTILAAMILLYLIRKIIK